MKSRILSMLAIVAVFCCAIAEAQIPRKLNYQGFITSPSGAAVNASVPMAFKLYDSVTGGNLLFTETHNPVTVSNGIFNILLGSVDVNGNPLNLSFGSQYYLGITIGTDPEMSPRQPLAASPYAIRAAGADSADALATGGTVGQVLAGTGAAPAWTGSPAFSGNVTVSGSLGIPTASTSAILPTKLNVVANSPKAILATTRALAVTSNDAAAPFALDVKVVGAPALVDRAIVLQTTDWNSADGGNLLLQPQAGNVGVGTSITGSKLTVAGRIESTSGGVKFPDGTTQITAAGGGGTLAGDVTGPQSATVIASATVTGKALTGFASGAGTISAADSVLTAFNKLDGNVALKAPLASPTFSGNVGVGATSLTSKLAVAGIIESTTGGIKFPDQTIQTTAATTAATSGTATRSPLQIATLRWDNGIQTSLLFTVGTTPTTAAFDGTNLWVVNASSNDVTRLRASDGACNGVVNPADRSACTFAVGTNPNGAAFDGSYVWLTSTTNNYVTKLRASDGACNGVVNPADRSACTFAVGTGPTRIAFDGTYLWVANGTGNTVTRLRATDGACNGVVNPADRSACTFGTGTSPNGVAVDGSNLWVVNNGGNSVTRLRLSDGACNGAVNPASVSACTFTVGISPRQIAFDGTYLWVTNNTDNSVTRLRATDGTCNGVVNPASLSACTFAVGIGPRGIAFDGVNLWVVSNTDNSVTKLRATDGACNGVINPADRSTCTFAGGTGASGVAFDGTNIWVVNQTAGNLTKLLLFPTTVCVALS